ncbi:ABC transporter ATP-binding protein [Sulfitobacter sp. TSTF-M16]|uniref:ABC transporter ATP-binding protein n=1 Tax=Sulfitobacter aestuariivivens TaxID=2766981 RepID=A0A927D366_9RHOB|nr:ABC transporter ATP-binding protein [Sulfitobacter aestuariivivens]MBD3664175.1 ABC transporter ATP-binding protein [Sulfitobacter aestuariivivens]
MALLETQALTANYGDFQALFGVDITLERGETVAIIGANGAGKTTLMRSLSGVLQNAPEQIQHKGTPVGALPADTIMKRGIAMVPEGRRLFRSLSVEENLVIGGQHKGGADFGDRLDSLIARITGAPDPALLAGGHDGQGYWTLDTIYELFPILRERRHTPGTALSGGQQQMVAIGRALMSNPDVLLCDEISLGLAPVVIKDIYAALPKIKETGASVIVVEQDIGQAMRVADRVYCMMEGRVTLSGRSSEISREAIHEAYFGATA